MQNKPFVSFNKIMQSAYTSFALKILQNMILLPHFMIFHVMDEQNLFDPFFIAHS